MEDSEPFGKVYTTCKKSYRGKAERRQREYRVNHLKVGWDGYGHLLDSESANAGMNFILPICHEAARKRDSEGKGVGERTFVNMLSSQAMCFNIFEPLNQDKNLCQKVLSEFIPDICSVSSVTIEYTPAKDLFQDQSGKGGVDCDVFIEAIGRDGQQLIIIIETKFVETEFSTCGYRKSGRENTCPLDVPIKSSIDNCLYVKNKKPPYLYWQRTIEHDILKKDVLPDTGCPFAGSLWQIWVNYVLANEEAKRRNASKAYFAVCASSSNHRLLNPKHNALNIFKTLLANEDSICFIDIDKVISAIQSNISGENKIHNKWVDGLLARYGNIAQGCRG